MPEHEIPTVSFKEGAILSYIDRYAAELTVKEYERMHSALGEEAKSLAGQIWEKRKSK